MDKVRKPSKKHNVLTVAKSVTIENGMCFVKHPVRKTDFKGCEALLINYVS
jgi:hypothetical protein